MLLDRDGGNREIEPDLLQELHQRDDQVCLHVELVMSHVRWQNKVSVSRFVAVVEQLLGLRERDELVSLSMHYEYRRLYFLKHLRIVHSFSNKIGEEAADDGNGSLLERLEGRH